MPLPGRSLSAFSAGTEVPWVRASSQRVSPGRTVRTEGAPAVDDGAHDLGEFNDDPVDTKLDLARAYIDMGDPEGARSILEEVLDEGDPNQRREAQSLIDVL